MIFCFALFYVMLFNYCVVKKQLDVRFLKKMSYVKSCRKYFFTKSSVGGVPMGRVGYSRWKETSLELFIYLALPVASGH